MIHRYGRTYVHGSRPFRSDMFQACEEALCILLPAISRLRLGLLLPKVLELPRGFAYPQATELLIVLFSNDVFVSSGWLGTEDFCWDRDAR